MIYTATAYRMKDAEGFAITPEVVESAPGNSPHVAMMKLACKTEDRDSFGQEVARWTTRNSAMIKGWIEKDDSQSYYCGEGRFRYEVQGDR